jgi:hypothetical protein
MAQLDRNEVGPAAVRGDRRDRFPTGGNASTHNAFGALAANLRLADVSMPLLLGSPPDPMRWIRGCVSPF